MTRIVPFVLSFSSLGPVRYPDFESARMSGIGTNPSFHSSVELRRPSRIYIVFQFHDRSPARYCARIARSCRSPLILVCGCHTLPLHSLSMPNDQAQPRTSRVAGWPSPEATGLACTSCHDSASSGFQTLPSSIWHLAFQPVSIFGITKSEYDLTYSPRTIIRSPKYTLNF